MLIKITQEAIDKYDIRDARNCPIWHAIAAELSEKELFEVLIDRVYIGGERVSLPPAVEAWQLQALHYLRSGEGSPPQPIEFELDYHPDAECGAQPHEESSDAD